MAMTKWYIHPVKRTVKIVAESLQKMVFLWLTFLFRYGLIFFVKYKI